MPLWELLCESGVQGVEPSRAKNPSQISSLVLFRVSSRKVAGRDANFRASSSAIAGSGIVKNGVEILKVIPLAEN